MHQSWLFLLFNPVKERYHVAHEFSLVIHDYLTTTIADVRKRKKKAESIGDYENVRFCDGQLEELFYFRQYLADQIDLSTQTYYD